MRISLGFILCCAAVLQGCAALQPYGQVEGHHYVLPPGQWRLVETSKTPDGDWSRLFRWTPEDGYFELEVRGFKPSHSVGDEADLATFARSWGGEVSAYRPLCVRTVQHDVRTDAKTPPEDLQSHRLLCLNSSTGRLLSLTINGRSPPGKGVIVTPLIADELFRSVM